MFKTKHKCECQAFYHTHNLTDVGSALSVFQSVFFSASFLPDKLKRIDLTANEITSIDDKAFLGLPELEELVIRENHLSQLPALPETMSLIDASHNNIGTKGIHKEAFKVCVHLSIYITQAPSNTI